MAAKIEKWTELRQGMSGGGMCTQPGAARSASTNLTSVNLFRGYIVKTGRGHARFDREDFGTYAECLAAAQAVHPDAVPAW